MEFNGIKSLDELIKIAAEKKEDKEEAPEGGEVKIKFKGTPADVAKGIKQVSKGLKDAKTIDELLKIASEKELILMRGISGSGKSHRAKRLIEEMGGEIFSTDEYPGLYGEPDEKGIPSFDVGKIGEAHAWNQKMVEEAMNRGESPIIVDNTNTQSWEMRPYVEMAKKHGYSYRMESPDSPWWKSLFSKDMAPESKEELINELYSRTRHIPKPSKEGDRDPIRMMLDRWEHNPTEEDILKSKAPWEE